MDLGITSMWNIYIYIYVCVCVCVCVYIYACLVCHAHTHTHILIHTHIVSYTKNRPLKNMKVTRDDDSYYMGKHVPHNQPDK